MNASTRILAAACCAFVRPSLAFQLPLPPSIATSMTAAAADPARCVGRSCTAMASTAAAAASTGEKASKSHLYIPSERDARYGGNVARYLLDLDEEGATFDFCGGMMFQLVLSDKLKSHLETVASNSEEDGEQPVIHPASQPLMSRIPDYQKSSRADNILVFHGRELRNIPTANGGMGFVLQLSYADPEGTASAIDESNGAAAGKGADSAWNGKAVDPQGWSAEEIATYDGWRGDSFRKWRNASLYTKEGYASFAKEHGENAFGLNHRFFLHADGGARMWLSAEDGCEGTPAEAKSIAGKLGEMLFGK